MIGLSVSLSAFGAARHTKLSRRLLNLNPS
jgi:hypothetical protein